VSEDELEERKIHFSYCKRKEEVNYASQPSGSEKKPYGFNYREDNRMMETLRVTIDDRSVAKGAKSKDTPTV